MIKQRDKNNDSSTETRPRKAYHKPVVVYREVLEAVAVDCISSGGKQNVIACPSGPVNS